MKLAFSGQGRYPDYHKGYELYLKRAKTDDVMDEKSYNRVIRQYCKMLAEQLYEDGMVDLPGRLGMITTAIFTRKPQYRKGKFVGYGKYDWTKGHFDGSMKAFGITILHRHDRDQNLRCYGFVANRRLFQRIKETFDNGDNDWAPVEFSNEMI